MKAMVFQNAARWSRLTGQANAARTRSADRLTGSTCRSTTERSSSTGLRSLMAIWGKGPQSGLGVLAILV